MFCVRIVKDKENFFSFNRGIYHRIRTTIINCASWVIKAIHEHIAGDGVGVIGACKYVGVEEAVVCRVVVAALQIIEAGFVIVVVATVTEGVQVGEGGAGGLFVENAVTVAVGDAGQLAPGVVGVCGVGSLRVAYGGTIRILHRIRAEDFHHVPLKVQRIEVVGKALSIVLGILDCERPPLGIVGKDHDLGGIAGADFFIDDFAVQGQVFVGHAAYHLGGANSVGIIGVGGGLAPGGNGGQPPPVLPRQPCVSLAVVPVQRIADGIVGDGIFLIRVGSVGNATTRRLPAHRWGSL